MDWQYTQLLKKRRHHKTETRKC